MALEMFIPHWRLNQLNMLCESSLTSYMLLFHVQNCIFFFVATSCDFLTEGGFHANYPFLEIYWIVYSAEDGEQSDCRILLFRCDGVICIRRRTGLTIIAFLMSDFWKEKAERYPDANSISEVMNSNQGNQMPPQHFESCFCLFLPKLALTA